MSQENVELARAIRGLTDVMSLMQQIGAIPE
jgi:hypothetical protein